MKIFLAKSFVNPKRRCTFAVALEEKSTKHSHVGVLVQLVRIPACHAGGRVFESRTHRSGERIWVTTLRLVAHSFLSVFLPGRPLSGKPGSMTHSSSGVVRRGRES